jgi:PPE-repeat protein
MLMSLVTAEPALSAAAVRGAQRIGAAAAAGHTTVVASDAADFGTLPPEINSRRLYAGPGSGPMLAAAAAWDRLADELYSTAASHGSAVSNLTYDGWEGPASASMATAAARYVSWMTDTALLCEQSAGQARAAAAAYEAAFAMAVPPTVIAANRSQVLPLVATNTLGQNAPAIAAVESGYSEMWAQDATAMYDYADASATASRLAPFYPPPATTSAAAPASQTAESFQGAGPSARTTLSQLISALPEVLHDLASPTSSSAVAPVTAALATINGTTNGVRVVGSAALRGLSSGVGVPGSLGHVDLKATAIPAPASASIGQAVALGRLSVPQTWLGAAQEIRPATLSLGHNGIALPEQFRPAGR